MRDYIEPVEVILELMGETLTFPDYTIKGFPGFSTSILYKGETSVYEVEKQVFLFRVSSKDCADNNIGKGNTFTFFDTVYEHTFRLESNPIYDLTGWCKLNVVWIGKINVL